MDAKWTKMALLCDYRFHNYVLMYNGLISYVSLVLEMENGLPV